MTTKQYRESHKAEISEYNRKYWIKHNEGVKINKRKKYLETTKSNPELLRKKWRSVDKQKEKARKEARKVKIIGMCQICKINKATERHHEDYSKPLDIQFLCLTCHHNIHSPNRKGCSFEDIQHEFAMYYTKNCKEPNTIRMHPNTVRKLNAEAGVLGSVRNNPITLFGMKIVEDSEMDEKYCSIYFEESKPQPEKGEPFSNPPTTGCGKTFDFNWDEDDNIHTESIECGMLNWYNEPMLCPSCQQKQESK